MNANIAIAYRIAKEIEAFAEYCSLLTDFSNQIFPQSPKLADASSFGLSLLLTRTKVCLRITHLCLLCAHL